MAGVRFENKIVGLDADIKRLRSEIRDFALKVSDDLVRSLKGFTPVRTGTAQRGWKRDIDRRGFTITNPVPYTEYLEKGTPRMRAANRGQGIIGPALRQTKGKYR